MIKIGTVDYFGKTYKDITLSIRPLMDYCPFKCKHCAFDSGPDREKREIDIRAARKIIDQIPDSNFAFVYLTGGGEPTCYSHFQELVEYVRDTSIENGCPIGVGLITNGHEFIGKTSEEMINVFMNYWLMGLDTISISDSEWHRQFNPDIEMIVKVGETFEPKLLVDKLYVPVHRVCGVGRARTELGIETSNCKAFWNSANYDIIGVFPDGYHICGHGRIKIAELDMPLKEVLDFIQNDPITNACNSYKNRLGAFLSVYKNELGKKLKERGLEPEHLENVRDDSCSACFELTSDPEMLKVLREVATKSL
jgi:hypothetical protein